MTSRLWGAAKVAVPVLFGLSFVAPSPLRGAERVCNGTLLQVQVNERGTSHSDRFSFLLGLDAEDLSKDAALSALNARLVEALRPFSRSPWVSSPSLHPLSYAIGGGAAGSRLARASSTITGEVSRDDYDALIQAAGRLPGVRLQ